VPNHYSVFLSPADREQFENYESALRKELSDYLLEHARSEGLALVTRPVIEFKTDDRLGLGEYGIQPQLLAPPEEGEEEPSQSDFGNTMVYSPDSAARSMPAAVAAPAGRALLVGGGKRLVLGGEKMTLGRSRDCDLVLDDPNVSRRHAEMRLTDDGWTIADLGSTNGIKVGGRRVAQARLSPGDEITIGLTRLTFELD
jgi:hypothetical protein